MRSRPPDPPFKLSGRGGRSVGKMSILIAAAPSRSLRALRYANAHSIPMATTTRLIVDGGAHPAIDSQAMREVSLLAGLFDAASHNKPFKLTARLDAVALWPGRAPQLKGDR